ncbi:MAG: hypothetical protein EOO47_16970 [Flavobacterium sp.]|nr:MAG: hypothetical protein EOO47_16970 [Flavobacterium sp.]
MIKTSVKYSLLKSWAFSVLFIGVMLFNSMHYALVAHSDVATSSKPHVQKEHHCLICDFTFGPTMLPEEHWSVSLFTREIIDAEEFKTFHRVSKTIYQRFNRGPPSV